MEATQTSPNSETITDKRLLYNGYEVRKFRTENDRIGFELTGISHIPGASVVDLKETLLLDLQASHSLGIPRPRLVLDYFAQEVPRLVKHLPLPVSRDQMQTMLRQASAADLLSSRIEKPVYFPLNVQPTQNS
eukprot:m.882497 g.882497  ORF g.882497 m.882497 type:complete len:133 (-) comp59873_c0_seq2:15453-15851(-)